MARYGRSAVRQPKYIRPGLLNRPQVTPAGINATSTVTATVSQIFGPAPPVKVRLAPIVRRYRRYVVQHNVRPPAVVDPIAILPPSRRKLAPAIPAYKRFRVQHTLRPPTLVRYVTPVDTIHSTSTVTGTLSATSPVTPAAISATSLVGTATVTLVVVNPDATTISTMLVQGKRGSRTRLRPPTAISPAVAAPPPELTTLRITFGPRPAGTRYVVKSTLKPPLYIAQPVFAPTAEQLKIRTKIPIQPRRLPARIAIISPAVVNPIVMSTAQQTITTSLAVAQTRQRRRVTTVRSKLSPPTSTLQPIQPGTLVATSDLSATVVRQQLIVPDPVMSTSTIGASIVRLRPVTGAVINATSDLLSVTLTGGTPQTNTDQPQPWAVHIHHHGR